MGTVAVCGLTSGLLALTKSVMFSVRAGKGWGQVGNPLALISWGVVVGGEPAAAQVPGADGQRAILKMWGNRSARIELTLARCPNDLVKRRAKGQAKEWK